MTVTDLPLNSPVHVTTKEGKQLEGVIAYLGPVDFAEGNDWVGVRLTSKSTGLGKNDGSVQGKEYFQCPPNCGMFVKFANISERKLSKLEELKLKRELGISRTSAAKVGTSSSTTTPSRTPGSSTTPSKSITPRKPETEQTAEESTVSETPSAQEKLEAIKRRREALAKLKEERADKTGAAPAETSGSAPSPAPRKTPVSSATSDEPSGVVDERFHLEIASKNKELDQVRQELQETKRNLQSVEEAHRIESQKQDQMIRSLQKENATLEKKLEQQLEKNQSRDSEKLSATALDETHTLRIQELESRIDEMRDELETVIREKNDSRRDLERERKEHQTCRDELTVSRSQATALQLELQALEQQSEKRTTTDNSHYKERALLQGEISALKRKVVTLEQDKINLDATIEDLVLDKEQLQQEKEDLQDKVEELKLDAETAQMEAEELRMELEDAQASVEKASSLANDGGEDEDKVQALALQNTRLREALIRLREQTSTEKMEMAKQLRAAEKEAEAGRAIMSEVESLRARTSTLQGEVEDLKDMVEQGSAFEQMVEDLSDRVLFIEEENLALQTTIRELEEGAELTAEMEEVQADEIKALSRDLEDRETLIRNLEEVIKIQRRRESDFQKTVSNYRSVVDTLKQEKQILLDLQQGNAGERSNAIASSQKALARAAQLVSDAAELRKREAQAVMDSIDSEVSKVTLVRFERLIPKSLVSFEVSAIHGEMLAVQVAEGCSRSLHDIGSSLSKRILPSLDSKTTKESASSPIEITDEVRSDAKELLYQGEFAVSLVETSRFALRLLAAGQWPGLLTPEKSQKLGAIVGHLIHPLDKALKDRLKMLKEEGVLPREQSNLEGYRQIFHATRDAIENEMQREENGISLSGWDPPGLQILHSVSQSKFLCVAAASSICTIMNAVDDISQLQLDLYKRFEQITSSANSICLRFTSVGVSGGTESNELIKAVSDWGLVVDAMVGAAKDFIDDTSSLESLSVALESVSGAMSKLSSLQRASHFQQNEDSTLHDLSPESTGFWSRMVGLVERTSSSTADFTDLNHILRGRWIEEKLESAVEKEPLLDEAKSSIEVLEGKLQSRQKEISILSARLSQLESLLAKSSSGSKTTVKSDKSAEDLIKLKEENRVLTEAMDVLQRQADEYENEIRALKDFKSPRKSGDSRSTPRRAVTSIADLSSPTSRHSEDSINAGVLEATIFRPALQEALHESARLKSRLVASAMEDLPPLGRLCRAGHVEIAARVNSLLSEYRMEKASTKLVDLAGTGTSSPRFQLREQRKRQNELTKKLEEAMLMCRRVSHS